MAEAELYQKPKLITIFGGSGFVGRHLAEVLTKRGYRVRIACRYPEKAYYMMQIGDVGQWQMMKVNVASEASAARALEGADAAVYLPGIAYNQGKNNFAAVHVRGAENVARLTAQNGQALVHISALSAGLGAAKGYLASKAEGEKRVRAAHKKAIIFRPSVIFGAEDRFFNRFATWARFTPFMPLVRHGETPLQPVYVGDVAEAIARALDGAAKPGEIYELGGPEVLTMRALMEEMLRVIRRRRRFINVPMPLALLAGGWCGFVGKVPLVNTILTAGEIRALRYDSVVSDEARRESCTLAGLGIEPAGIDAHLATYLWRFRVAGQFSGIMGRGAV